MATRRVMREIKKAILCKDFLFIYDDEGKYGQKGCGYVKFTPMSGTYIGQEHIIMYKFNHEGKQYPFQPPYCAFLTPIYHANIHPQGKICLDTLQNNWSPMYGIDYIQKTIGLLLDQPNHDSPYNIDASKDGRNSSKEEYQKICINYYLTKTRSLSGQVRQLIESNEWQ